MVGEGKLKELCDFALSVSVAHQTEVVMGRTASNTTRYAQNRIHQNISQESMTVIVRSILNEGKGKKIGVAYGNASSKDAIRKITLNSNEIAKIQVPDPYFKSLPKPQKIKKIKTFDKKIQKLSLKEKAEVVKKIIALAKKEKMVASGIFETVVGESAVINSLGVWAYHQSTRATITTVMSAENSTGYASQTSYILDKIDSEKIAKKAIEKAKSSADPKDIEPGRYDVILEEEAVGEMIGYLAYRGFGGKHVHEDMSFASGKIGKKVFGENITIWDDPLNLEGLPEPFDYEGWPKKKILLVEKGILKNIVYDTYTGGKYSKKSTGHSVGSTSFGPIPINMILKPGDKTKQEMLKSTKKGIWVTRFWYGNIQHYKKLNMTGMTRDGTFLIENGKITKPLKNLRFTQSITEALNNVEMVGINLKLVEQVGNHLVPALKIKNFSFTSQTEH